LFPQGFTITGVVRIRRRRDLDAGAGGMFGVRNETVLVSLRSTLVALLLVSRRKGNVIKGFWGPFAASLRSQAVGVLLCVGIGQATAAAFLVTTTAGTNAGACTVSLCSLRDAIIAANANAGADIITLPAGIYTLAIAGQNEDAAATGDLDITDSVTINGAGAATTIVDGGAIDRVFHVISGTVVINNVTIRNGLAASAGGGGILIAGAATRAGAAAMAAASITALN
jgi:CSLREA domain-containing protein